MLTQQQLDTFKTALLTETDAAVVAARTPATRDDRVIVAFYNAASATIAWRTAASIEAVDDAPNYSNYDTLAAGKRDSWALFLTRPRDFTRQKVRNWVTDVWGAATASSNSEAILQAGTETALRIEDVLGGTVRTTGTVSALDRAYVGTITLDEVSAVLNG